VSFYRVVEFNCGSFNTVTEQFTELLKIDERERLFDDLDFSKSKLYFEGLELLRVFSEWIAETQKDLKDLQPDTSDSIQSEANIYNFASLGAED